MSVELSMDKLQQGEISLIRVSGEFDFRTESQFTQFAMDIPETDLKKVIVDLTEIDFIDSGSLGSLIKLQQRVQLQNGRLVLACVSRRISKILELTRLNAVIRSAESVEDAEKILNEHTTIA